MSCTITLKNPANAVSAYVFFFLQALNEKAKSITGVHQWPYRAVSRALEVIPKTLIQNCGASTIRTLTALRVRVKPAYSTFSATRIRV